ncbi:MAG: SIS domain-containing protein [Armatimonadetes bacterium]|nr:SIS domain-containing protein [Armatimonadota bacterium]
MSESPETAPEFERFLYPFLGEEESVPLERALAEVRESTRMKCRETVGLRRELLALYTDDLITAARSVADAFTEGRRLFAFGNGGSATDAADIVADLLHPPRFRPERAGGEGPRRALPALDLSHDVATVTAIANDVGFENVFVRQLIAFGRVGDVALGISTSGNSPNIVAAFRTAKRVGMITLALAGYDGGRCAELAREGTVDHLFVVPSSHIPRIQEAQATIYHTLWDLVHRILESSEEKR